MNHRGSGGKRKGGTSDQAEELPLSRRMPDWVLGSKLSDGERYAWGVGDGAYMKREAEKAALVGNSTDFGEVTVWVPKSVIMTSEQVGANDESAAKRFQAQWSVTRSWSG